MSRPGRIPPAEPKGRPIAWGRSRPSWRLLSRSRALVVSCALAGVAACASGGAAAGARSADAARSGPPSGVPGGGALPARLVSTDELARLLESAEPAILDVRTDIAQYLADHLPGAVYLNTETLRAEDGGVPNLLLPRESYAILFSRLGIHMDRPVVIYASGESRNIDATYVAWILSGFGHSDVRVLDGGYAKWQLEGRPLTRKYPRYEPTKLPPGSFAVERATLEDVRAAISRHTYVLVDARPRDQYTGDAGAQLRRGHIPGAVSHDWQTDLVEGEFAKTWKTPDEIRAAYDLDGISPDRTIIAYCNGGLESSHVWFTLRVLLGYPDVRVYDGSFTEWSEREDLPIETGLGRCGVGRIRCASPASSKPDAAPAAEPR